MKERKEEKKNEGGESKRKERNEEKDGGNAERRLMYSLIFLINKVTGTTFANKGTKVIR